MKTLLIACTLWMGASAAYAGLDFTPKYEAVAGGLIKRAYFSDGDKKYAVTIDEDTTLAAENGGAIFRFTKIPQATLSLRPTPFQKPPAFTQEFLPDYAKAAEGMLPATKESLEIVAQGENVYPINQWKSYRFVYLYKIAGISYQESITFLVLDTGEQIVVRAGGLKKDYAAVQERADDTIRRWHEVLPGDELGFN